MHELGHYATCNYVTEEDIQERDRLLEKENISLDDQLSYFVCQCEWEATTWACYFYRDNKAKIEELLVLLEEPRVRFFELVKETS